MSEPIFTVAGVKFSRDKFSALDGETCITYTSPEFSAGCKRSGVKFDGTILIENHAQLDEFAKFVGMCWTEHRKLMPKIVKDIAGSETF